MLLAAILYLIGGWMMWTLLTEPVPGEKDAPKSVALVLSMLWPASFLFFIAATHGMDD